MGLFKSNELVHVMPLSEKSVSVKDQEKSFEELAKFILDSDFANIPT